MYGNIGANPYKSHENGQGRKLVTDKRQNIFSSKMLWFKAAGLLIMAVIALFYLFWFFTSNGNSQPEQQTKDFPAANNITAAVHG
ncbi:hypothetical protein [Candidatus Erwinia dacicola]|uniref:Uncharacterized protein n=1 Tax=Candidatus Erwinia dacicola TaxID=252393 RepID=A0A328TRD0_9GAMM|nr:hypothetical protein [Candidatus Erwinia dacicola]RAP70356.1 hypothetical protein ACZ87_02839 [Candidatus Erwinia dacicola]